MAEHDEPSRIIQAILDLKAPVTHPDHAPVDLGSDHAYTKEIVAGEWVGIWEWHFDLAGKLCTGVAYFDTPAAATCAGTMPRWTVESFDPLTMRPSLWCDPSGKRCASHGFITNGRWA